MYCKSDSRDITLSPKSYLAARSEQNQQLVLIKLVGISMRQPTEKKRPNRPTGEAIVVAQVPLRVCCSALVRRKSGLDPLQVFAGGSQLKGLG